MRVTIVPSDNVVLVDFRPLNTLDLSELDPNIHAIQWNDGTGHIEYKDGSQNETLTDTLLFDEILAQYAAAIYIIDHPVFTIEELRAKKKSEIESARESARQIDVSALGHVWQADPTSQDLLNKAIMLAGNGLPLPDVWRDVSNIDMPITSLNELLAIAGAIGAQTQAAYSKSWGLKALVEAATTAEELALIVW